MKQFYLIALLCWGCWLSVAGQKPIKIYNPSFEDSPRHSKVPNGWFDCGTPYESPPDIHPTADQVFGVSKAAIDGDTYLGMVVRDNDTEEAIGTRLKVSLKAGTCYQFSIFLARSETYKSISRATEKMVEYTTPTTLRIWGGNNYCLKDQLLAVSPFIDHDSWQEYTFQFKPEMDYKYLTLQAFYTLPVLFPYNGHILLDAMSDITVITCDDSFDNQDFVAIDERSVTSLSPIDETEETTQSSDKVVKLPPPINDESSKYYLPRSIDNRPVWELEKVPYSRLLWCVDGADVNLNLDIIRVPVNNKNDINYLKLFAQNYGKNIIHFVINGENTNRAKKLRKVVLREAKYWKYPEWAYDFKLKK